MTKLDEALLLAVAAHAGQVDKAGRPQILHALQVLLNLGPGATEEERIVAVLHDVLETHGVSWIPSLQQYFGDAVMGPLVAISRTANETYSEYIDRVAGNPVARKVKIADLQHNLDKTRMPEERWREFEHLWKRYERALVKLEK